MDWEPLIIPLLSVAAWIVYSILRGAGESQKSQRAEPPRPRVAPAQVDPEGERSSTAVLIPVKAPTARPQPDLDRFMKDVNRRRRRTEEREAIPEVTPAARTEPRIQRTPVALVVPPVPLPAPLIDAVPIAIPVSAPMNALPPKATPELPPGLARLLQSAEGMRTAIILKEALGPPVSYRRR